MRIFVVILTVCAVTSIAMGKKVSAKDRICNSLDKPLPVWYDPTTHICKNGTLHPKESTSHPEDALNHPSCGLTKYELKTQTCCVQTINQYKIHDGPHSTHVCCGLEAYPRGDPNLPCKHPSMNDPLFEPTNLKKYIRTTTFCSKEKYRFSLELKQRYMSPTFHYNATLTPLNSPYAASKHVKVAIDKYSPRKSLDGKTLLIVSENNLSQDQTFDFYLQSSDEVYTGTCNSRTLFNRLTKKYSRKCKDRKRRSLFRRLYSI